MKLATLIELPLCGDDRGSLVAIEAGDTVPFEIKRVYYIFGTKVGVSRGFHAHKCLDQVLVCLSGSCRIILDDGSVREEVVLDSSVTGLLIDKPIWREMHDFTADCVLLVLANKHYNEDDYIRSYEDFKSSVQ